MERTVLQGRRSGNMVSKIHQQENSQILIPYPCTLEKGKEKNNKLMSLVIDDKGNKKPKHSNISMKSRRLSENVIPGRRQDPSPGLGKEESFPSSI